jgi:hypothetical protein
VAAVLDRLGPASRRSVAIRHAIATTYQRVT